MSGSLRNYMDGEVFVTKVEDTRNLGNFENLSVKMEFRNKDKFMNLNEVIDKFEMAFSKIIQEIN